ncbi:MAG TPA: type II toxin-antitoxin system VapC family toxin [Bradyrhizobium sp.]|nr:type II toxin-antitoxin system VapC family toxin [Bradyrhizobium sp.]
MIVVDSSVFIAILEQEPEAERFLSIIRDATRTLASAVTVYKTGIVICARRGRQSAEEVMAFLRSSALRSCRLPNRIFHWRSMRIAVLAKASTPKRG